MKTVETFPKPITVLEDVRIPMPDGVTLSARLWLPTDASEYPVPLILEHLPYRKRDGTIARDEGTHPYLAGHGYACLRTDMRGNGDSDGFMKDEYTQMEWDDALAVMSWARAQDWCDGSIGMMGISWGGFNGLQLAALRPPGLKAVISLCSTSDRYADDIHHKGGAMLGENLGWAAQMLAYSSRPPDPALVGDRWRAMWLDRLEAQPFLLETWLQHQRRDAYWEHGSICEDFGAIDIPVLALGGWHDGYRNTPATLVRELGTAKAIVGPWIHKYPHFAGPEPKIGFLQEALRWWDRWLKGIETGVEIEPRERLWLMDSIEPQRWVDARPGRWIGVNEDAPREVLHFGDGVLGYGARPFERTVASPQNCGRAGGEYFPFAFGPELPADQVEDDTASFCFDGEITDVSKDIVGAAQVSLSLTPKAASGMVAVRLCDLRPDGTSALISHGFLNLSHHTSHANPQALAPGAPIEVRIGLDQCAYRLPAGHRLRVAISSTYWPFLWPQPDAGGFAVTAGALSLPVLQEAREDVTFEPPEAAIGWKAEALRPAGMTRRMEVADDGTETTIIEIDDGKMRDMAHGLESGSRCVERWSIHPDDPLSAHADITWDTTLGRGDWQVRTQCTASLTADSTTWYPRASITAWEGESQIFSRNFASNIKRDFM